MYVIVYSLYIPIICTIIVRSYWAVCKLKLAHYNTLIIINKQNNKRTYSTRIAVTLARLAFVLVVDETVWTKPLTENTRAFGSCVKTQQIITQIMSLSFSCY